MSVGKGVIGSYVHNAVIDGLGKIGVIVALEFDRQEPTNSRARPAWSRCMSPPPIRRRSIRRGLDPAVVQREKDVLADKFKAQGKPANVIEKIVEFGLKTFYKEVCLLDQAFIHDDKTRASRRR